MKPATRAILILSALLALSLGWIIFSQIRGDAALHDAQTRLTAAEDKRKAADALNAQLALSNAAKDRENKAQAVTIATQSVTIASLKADQIAAHNIAGANVAQGADLKKTYDAGKPVVDTVAAPALTSWYALLGLKIDPVIASGLSLQFQVDIMGPRIMLLEGQNKDLTDSNGRMQGTIDADAVTIADQKGKIDGIGADLSKAHDDVTTAIGRANFNGIMAVTFGITTAAELAYILAHAFGLVK